MHKAWYNVARVEDIPIGTGLPVVVGDDDDCVVFRTETGEVRATGLLCPHQNEPLDNGHLEGCEVICRRHHLRFDIRNGDCTNAGGFSLRTFDLKIEDGDVFVGRWED